MAMGWPCLPIGVFGNYETNMPDACKVSKLDRAEYKSLVGNGIHMATMYAFRTYIFSHMARRSAIEPLCRFVVQETAEDDAEQDLAGCNDL